MKTILKSAIFALALAVTASASAEGYMFNKNLTVGARGADVTALQDRLAAEGYFTYTSTGYFGSMTRTAVKAYQTAKGISPAAGFVGPLTRSTLNSAAPVVPTVPGTVVPPVLSGQEGFGEYRLAPTPVNNTNIQTSSDVPVYGLEIKAKNADISFERLTLDVMVENTGTSGFENPATLINSISVKDGSTVVATLPVTSSSFSKYTGTNNYYIQISGLSTRVAKDTIKTFTVHFNTNSIDTSRNVTVNVAANGIRVVDGRGISTYNASAIGARAHTFKKPGNSTLLVKGDATTIYATNYRINNSSNGAEKALTSTFAIKSESGPSKITAVTVTVATSTGGTMPTNLYLYQGSTLLDARTVSAGTVSFDIENSNVVVAQDTTTTFTIKADMPATTVNGSAVRTTVTAVSFEKADGSSSSSTGLTIAGPYHFFATVVPVLTKISSTAVTVLNNNINTSVTANVKLGITANGGDILVASTTAVIGLRNIATGATLATTTVTGTTESGLTSFADGSTKSIEFTANFASTSFSAGTTNVKTFIESIKYATSTGATWFNLTAGFEPFDSDGFASFSK